MKKQRAWIEIKKGWFKGSHVRGLIGHPGPQTELWMWMRHWKDQISHTVHAEQAPRAEWRAAGVVGSGGAVSVVVPAAETSTGRLDACVCVQSNLTAYCMGAQASWGVQRLLVNSFIWTRLLNFGTPPRGTGTQSIIVCGPFTNNLWFGAEASRTTSSLVLCRESWFHAYFAVVICHKSVFICLGPRHKEVKFLSTGQHGRRPEASWPVLGRVDPAVR